jgi:hypothetical protein
MCVFFYFGQQASLSLKKKLKLMMDGYYVNVWYTDDGGWTPAYQRVQRD